MYVQNKPLRRPWAQAVVLAMLASQTLPALAEQTRSHTVFALEHALVGVGYELNPVDGIMDPVTEQALRDYQSKHANLAPTGQIDDATLMALGIQPTNATSQAQPDTTTTASATTTDADPAPQESSEADQDKGEGRSWFFF